MNKVMEEINLDWAGFIKNKLSSAEERLRALVELTDNSKEFISNSLFEEIKFLKLNTVSVLFKCGKSELLMTIKVMTEKGKEKVNLVSSSSGLFSHNEIDLFTAYINDFKFAEKIKKMPQIIIGDSNYYLDDKNP